MMYFLVKNWKLFVDILLVVGAIIAFTFWDPIGMFTNAKTKQTANLVTGVRDIGQLVTAEYYGEVISSWKEFKLTEFPADTLTDFAEEAWREIRFTVWENRTKPKELKLKVRNTQFCLNLPNKNVYNEFVVFLGDKYLSRKLDRIYDGKQLKKGVEQTIYRKILDELKAEEKSIRKRLQLRKRNDSEELKEEMEELILETPAFIYDFFPYYQFLVDRGEGRKDKKKNIVFIGRGSVKAGFDFGKLDESNFLYDEDSKTINFYGIKPEVLDVDINPWFIPERKVKGFELVTYSEDVSFIEAKEVKRQCKQKLLAQAKGAQIVENAEENAREALRSFFSLLLDEPDIKVSFHTQPFDLHLAIIKADTLIDKNEALFIDSLYQHHLRISDTVSVDKKLKLDQHFKLFIASLRKLPFMEKEYDFNYYAMSAARVLQDTFHVSKEDVIFLNSVRGKITSTKEEPENITNTTMEDHALWFTDDFRKEFNGMLALLKQEQLSQFDSTFDLNTLRFSEATLDSTSIAEERQLLQKLPDSVIYKEMRTKELATIDSIFISRGAYENKVRPLDRFSSSITDFINRLKK